MSYVTGTANGFGELQAAFLAALQAAGWQGIGSGQGEFALATHPDYLQLSATAAGVAAPGKVRMVNLKGNDPIVWPARYEIHVLDNPKEAYCILNYNVDRYQYLAMGVSPALGIPGTGVWISGTAGERLNYSGNDIMFLYDTNNVVLVGSYASQANPALLSGGSGLSGAGAYWHDGLSDGLPGGGWCPNRDGNFNLHESLYGNGGSSGQLYCAALLRRSPSAANLATPLLPVYGVRNRRDNGASIGVALAHARYCRIDHYSPGEVITYGSDRWKIYPEYRKNVTVRNGESAWQGSLRGAVPHSGTFGWAVRYTGP